jgi:hypothetical protein
MEATKTADALRLLPPGKGITLFLVPVAALAFGLLKDIAYLLIFIFNSFWNLKVVW